MNKPFWRSRGVWIGIFTTLIGVGEVIREAIMAGDFSTLGIVTAALGVLKVFERVSRSNS